jgi:hypothetical protein
MLIRLKNIRKQTFHVYKMENRNEGLLDSAVRSSRLAKGCVPLELGRSALFRRYNEDLRLWVRIPEGAYVVINVSDDFDPDKDNHIEDGNEEWFRENWQKSHRCCRTADLMFGGGIYETDLNGHTLPAIHYRCSPEANGDEAERVFQRLVDFVQKYCNAEDNDVQVYTRSPADGRGIRVITSRFDLYRLVFIYDVNRCCVCPVQWGDVIIKFYLNFLPMPRCSFGAGALGVLSFENFKDRYDVIES